MKWLNGVTEISIFRLEKVEFFYLLGYRCSQSEEWSTCDVGSDWRSCISVLQNTFARRIKSIRVCKGLVKNHPISLSLHLLMPKQNQLVISKSKLLCLIFMSFIIVWPFSPFCFLSHRRRLALTCPVRKRKKRRKRTTTKTTSTRAGRGDDESARRLLQNQSLLDTRQTESNRTFFFFPAFSFPVFSKF